MSLALPAALWGLALLPAVILLRALARRPRLVVVPSLIPWRGASGAAAADRRRMLIDLPLLLQLAAVTAAVVAAAGPELSGEAAGPRRVAVVLDNSASMAARPAGGETRLAGARRRVRQELSKLGPELAGVLLVTSPRPRQVAGPGAGRSRLFEALAAVEATGAGGDLAGAVVAARRSAGRGAVLLVASDEVGALGGLADEERVVMRAGGPVRNLGIVAAAVEDGRVFCAVRNASSAGEGVTLRVKAAGTVSIREATLKAGERRGFTLGFPHGAPGFIELGIGPDALAADNAVWLSAGAAPRPVVLGRPASSTERALAALGFGPARRLAAGAGLPGDARLLVACGLWPEAVPPGGFALVLDPPAGALGGISASEKTGPARARLGSASVEYFPHAGSFSFEVREARELKLAAGARALLSGGGRPLVALSADGRVCVLAFDPEAGGWVKHPSFPVFFARLAENAPALAAMRRSFYRTGGPAPAAAGARLVAPSGRAVAPGERLAEVGVYRVEAGGRVRRRFAANLLDEAETACRVAGRREIRRLRPAGEARRERRVPLAPWLFALALLALAAEWAIAIWGGPRLHVGRAKGG